MLAHARLLCAVCLLLLAAAPAAGAERAKGAAPTISLGFHGGATGAPGSIPLTQLGFDVGFGVTHGLRHREVDFLKDLGGVVVEAGRGRSTKAYGRATLAWGLQGELRLAGERLLGRGGELRFSSISIKPYLRGFPLFEDIPDTNRTFSLSVGAALDVRHQWAGSIPENDGTGWYLGGEVFGGPGVFMGAVHFLGEAFFSVHGRVTGDDANPTPVLVGGARVTMLFHP